MVGASPIPESEPQNVTGTARATIAAHIIHLRILNANIAKSQSQKMRVVAILCCDIMSWQMMTTLGTEIFVHLKRNSPPRIWFTGRQLAGTKKAGCGRWTSRKKVELRGIPFRGGTSLWNVPLLKFINLNLQNTLSSVELHFNIKYRIVHFKHL